MRSEKIKAFVDYGVNKELTGKQLKSMTFGMSIFYIIGIFYGLILGGTELVFGMAILIVTFISTVFIIIKSKTLSLKNYCIIFGAISLQASINFLLMTLILCQMLEVNMLINVVILLTPLFIMILYFIITKNRVNKGEYLNIKVVKKKNIKFYSLLGGVAGMFIARTALAGIGQTTALLIAIICSLFFSSIFSLGTINFLKYKYICQLEQEGLLQEI